MESPVQKINFYIKEIKVADGLEICGMGMSGGAFAGAVIGGLASVSIGIWLCVDFIQPALASVDGISGPGASAITAAIALLGGLEAMCGVGMCAGVIGGAITGAIGGAIVGCCSSDDAIDMPTRIKKGLPSFKSSNSTFFSKSDLQTHKQGEEAAQLTGVHVVR
jgi:hypothetical protein